jgi:murein DD-endopeptidase MepM/ murein hydrolase activator NlpD
VVRITDRTIGGNSIFVMGRGGRTYYYAHLDRYAEMLHVGDEVSRGTLLGYVGNTGNARTTRPHLHFGVYTPTGAINPLPLLAGAEIQPRT